MTVDLHLFNTVLYKMCGRQVVYINLFKLFRTDIIPSVSSTGVRTNLFIILTTDWYTSERKLCFWRFIFLNITRRTNFNIRFVVISQMFAWTKNETLELHDMNPWPTHYKPTTLPARLPSLANFRIIFMPSNINQDILQPYNTKDT